MTGPETAHGTVAGSAPGSAHGTARGGPVRPVPRQEATRSTALLAYLLVLVSLQIFLLVVAVEGLLGDDPGLARGAAILSVVLFASTLILRRFVDGR